MLTIASHQGNTNQNHTKIPTHSHCNGYHQEHKQLMFLRMSKRRERSYAVIGNVNYYNMYGKQYGGFSKLKVELRCDPALSFLGISRNECKSGYNTDTCTSMFTAALLITEKICTHQGRLTTDKWIKKRMKFCSLQVNGWNWRTST